MRNTKSFIVGMACLAAALQGQAQIQFPSVFSDGMVLQQNSKVAVWGWGDPSEELMLLSGWNPGDTVRVVVDNQGCWKAELETGRAGGPYVLEVKSRKESRKLSDVMLGEVWLCSGQSNMEWSADMGIMNGEEEVKQAACPSVRIFHMPKQGADTPQTDCRTAWETASPESMRRTSATAYFFARYLTEKLNVPVGIMVAAWGGTPAEVWTPESVVKQDEILSKNQLKEFPWWPIKPGVLYNQMIHPMVPYRIAGCLWYQGEANHENASSYARLMSKMVEAWRKDFGWNFPFYYVQIAPYTYGASGNTPALLREQQELMLDQVENTAMINISDLVENVKDIHPRNKRAIGERLACLAMDKVYGQFTEPYESPRLGDARLVKRNIEITLEGNFESLQSATKEIVGLTLIDGNGEQTPVKARLQGKKLLVPVRGKAAPYQVLYSFDEATIGSLRTEAGLPVLPFRTEKLSAE